MISWAEESLQEAIELAARSGRNDMASDLRRILETVDFHDLQIMRLDGLDEIAGEVVEVSSFGELVDLLGRLAGTIGVNHCTLHVVTEAPTTNFSTKVVTTYPEEWVTHYVNHRYSFLDPVGRACLSGDRAFHWDILDHDTPALRAFWENAAAHGVGPAGYTIPIITDRGDKVALSVCASDDEESFRERVERYEGDLHSLGVFFVDAFCRTASEDRPTTFNPTDDQLSILRAIAMGASEAELRARSYQYGSYTTLERSICTLFRTKTVAQAAVLAGRVGILVDAPLTKSDILAASGKTATGRVMVSPNGASLRRLVRLRNAAPFAAAKPTDTGATILRISR